MVRAGLLAGAAATPVVVLVAGLVRGVEGIVAAVAALGLVLANFAVSGAALAYAAKRNKILFPAIAMPSYAFRMLAMLMAMKAFREIDMIDVPAFAITFSVGVVALLAYECWIYTKTPWLALTFSPTKETPS
jgi:hypothetical protein